MSTLPQQGQPARLSVWDLTWLNLYWFATSFHWGALLTVVIPAEVLRFVPETQKGSALGLLFGIGAAVAMVVTPFAGALSDRSLMHMGRRRPFMIAGTLANCLALIWMKDAAVYAVFLVAYLAVQASDNCAAGAFHGLIPDKVSSGQRGVASGLMGLTSMIGTSAAVLLAGRLVGGGQTGTMYWAISAVILFCMALMTVTVKEERMTGRPPVTVRAFFRSFWIDPRAYPDFAWLFVTRGLVMLGFYTILGFLQFYLKDTLGLSREEAARATGTLSGVAIAAAVGAALLGGWLSDRIGRKAIVSVAGLLLALTSVGLLFQPPFHTLIGIAILLGLGSGAYTSVDWALAIDVLPSRHSSARDLGIWGVANTLPQVTAPLIAGPLLDLFNHAQPGAGYSVIFSMAIVYTVLGSILVWKIKGSR